MSPSVAKLICRRFGAASSLAKTVLGPNPELSAIEAYYSSVLVAIVRRWCGTILAEPACEWDERLFAELPLPDETADHFGPLYQNLVSPTIRKERGEFYTPGWLIEHLLQTAVPRGSDSVPVPVLDPACGSGAFLLAVVDRLKKAGFSSERILASIAGFDLNPIAVLTARANILAALFAGKKTKTVPEIPIHLFDCLQLDQNSDFPLPSSHFPLLLGNPPWINWDRFFPSDREQMYDLWRAYGLFNLSGKEARYGGAKKELAALVLLRAADLYLAEGGRIAMVVPQRLFQTDQSGSGFRRFRIATTEVPLRVVQVDDFSGVAVFSGVATKAATVLLEKGQPTAYPVPYFRWLSKIENFECRATPVDPNNPLSAWEIRDFQGTSRSPGRKPTGSSEINDRATVNTHISFNFPRENGSGSTKPRVCRGRSLPPIPATVYQGYLGANTGGANGVYWVEILGKRKQGTILIRNTPALGKRELPEVEAEIESELVFPLLRWGDVDRFRFKEPSLGILLPQDVRTRAGIPEAEMQARFPKALAYLRQFEAELRERAAFRKYQSNTPFYSMYNIGPQTLAPHKVVWRRMDDRLRAVALAPFAHPLLGTRPIVPQETLVLVPCETEIEAGNLAVRLNAPETEAKVAAFSVPGTKSFGSPGILKYLAIEKPVA